MAKRFPSGFYWGAATASFQIEGALREDGRGETIWDRFAATPGKIVTGETGEPATDSYHLYHQDVALLREMGLNAYRFSTAWPRIIPGGTGPVNALGLDYYDRVVDALLQANVTPFVTLYHWDLPQALQDRGGWANRTTIDAFLRYVQATVERLGDRVKHWMTFNEPWCVSILGHEIGEHAPGMHDRRVALQVAHHVLVAHGLAVPIIRQTSPGAEVGIVLNFTPAYPATDTQADWAAAREFNVRHNVWFVDPVMGRGYPRDGWAGYGTDVPEVLPDDMEVAAAPIDFLGVNYYTRAVCHDPAGGAGRRVVNRRDETRLTARGWESYPQALYDLLLWLQTEYAFPKIYITENGAAYDDVVAPDGRIHDPLRQSYIREHLATLLRTLDAGVPVAGYFCWTLTDNFEWAMGRSSRFGLAYTDYATQRRILKESGKWFGRVARANALVD